MVAETTSGEILESMDITNISKAYNIGQFFDTFVCEISTKARGLLEAKYWVLDPHPELAIVRNGVLSSTKKVAHAQNREKLRYTLLWNTDGRITVCKKLSGEKMKWIVSKEKRLEFPNSVVLTANEYIENTH